MENDVFTEKLAWFKENERPEVVLVVGDNGDLMKIVVAWSNIDVRRTARISPLNAQSEHEAWKWLWQNTRYSLEEIAIQTGLEDEVLDVGMDVLIGNRVLYPDGTINSFVQRYLREKVLKLFEAKPRKVKQKVS